MGTMLVAIVVVFVVGTALLAVASYRRHSRAAKARSLAALNILLAEAYELSANADTTSAGRKPVEPTPDPSTPDAPGGEPRD